MADRQPLMAWCMISTHLSAQAPALWKIPSAWNTPSELILDPPVGLYTGLKVSTNGYVEEHLTGKVLPPNPEETWSPWEAEELPDISCCCSFQLRSSPPMVFTPTE